MKLKLILTALLFSNCIYLQAQFALESELRTRLELRDGYRELVQEGSVPAVLIWQRTRISFGYETEDLSLKITPQDSRLWGRESITSSTGVFGDNASLDLYEGYAGLKTGKLGWISIGRQELKYDNQRLLGSRNWNNHGLTYDGVVFKMQPSNWDIHLGTIWNSLVEASSSNTYPANRIKNLNFVWAHQKINDNMSISLLHLASGATETDSTNKLHYKHTTGFYSVYKKNGLEATGDAYYQYGNTNEKKRVSAFLIAANAGFTIGKFILGTGFAYISGNSKLGEEQTKENLFDIHYGARHRYYGNMDYFRNFASNTNNGGLSDYYFYFNCKFSKLFTICNTGHYFKLTQTNSSTPENNNLGYENDFVFKYKFNNWGALDGGYLFFLPTNSFKILHGTAGLDYQQFAYIQLTLTPTLFKQ